MSARRIAVLTGTRADYGLLRWIMTAIDQAPDFELVLLVTGSHLSPDFGFTLDEIRADGWRPAEEIEILLSSDSGAAMAKSMGLGLIGFADAFRRQRPDLLLVLGDRFEAFAAATAAACCGVPVAHLCGGEVTEGALDEGWRHAITKIAHLHFPATRAFADRIARMGEDPARIHVVGSPGLEAIRRLHPLRNEELARMIAMDLSPRTLLVTVHPETTGGISPEEQAETLLAALDRVDAPVVFTAPNADAGGRALRARVEAFVARRAREAALPPARLVPSLGSRAYLSLLRVVGAVVGNSSSGLIEAPSFELPAVNVGARQGGRPRAANVIDVGWDAGAIAAAIERALEPEFRAGLRGLQNPYGDGGTSERVLAELRSGPWGPELLRKRFRDQA